MSRRYPRRVPPIMLEGQFENSVLGRFRIIRGFANLKDLASISVPYEMQDAVKSGEVDGQQRKIDSKHAASIKNYLENGDQQFLPEVILSLRAKYAVKTNYLGQEVGVSCNVENRLVVLKRWNSEYHRIHQLIIGRTNAEWVRSHKIIRRIDGNHRLDQALMLKDDPRSPTKYLAPFCLILLGPPGDEADDYSESLIFHTINSTALPLESEHALKLILGQKKDLSMTAAQEFAFNPDLHFTRLLHEGLLKLSKPAQERLGSRPLTSLDSATRSLRELDPKIVETLPALQKFATDFLAALDDIVTRLEPLAPGLCNAEFFIELSARVWKSMPETDSHNARVNATVWYLEQLSVWLGRDGFTGLKEGHSISKQLLDIYNVVRTRMPKKVFLARWYPTAKDGEEFEKAKLRLDQIRRTLQEIGKESGVHLELVDMGTQAGGTFPIHPKMYEAISSSDIILVDLTGVRPNVCVEAGFALRDHEKNRLIFIFQPNEANKDVPFDLNTFRYEPFKDTGEILGKIKPHIEAILRSASS